MKANKERLRLKRHRRIRLRLHGTDKRLRMVVYRSLRNLDAQIIDDTKGHTLLSISTLDNEIKQKFPYGGNTKAAEFLGEVFARRAKEKGISRIVLDRGGYLYHGRIKAFAESLRKAGLEF